MNWDAEYEEAAGLLSGYCRNRILYHCYQTWADQPSPIQHLFPPPHLELRERKFNETPEFSASETFGENLIKRAQKLG